MHRQTKTPLFFSVTRRRRRKIGKFGKLEKKKKKPLHEWLEGFCSCLRNKVMSSLIHYPIKVDSIEGYTVEFIAA